jgi:hypothetical protein
MRLAPCNGLGGVLVIEVFTYPVAQGGHFRLIAELATVGAAMRPDFIAKSPFYLGALNPIAARLGQACDIKRRLKSKVIEHLFHDAHTVW